MMSAVYPYPVTVVPMSSSVGYQWWMLPYNNSLIRHPTFQIGWQSEFSTSIIGDLENENNKCILFDPMFPVPLPLVDELQCKHNISDLIKMTDDFLCSPARELH
jgi:hypothetical protein